MANEAFLIPGSPEERVVVDSVTSELTGYGMEFLNDTNPGAAWKGNEMLYNNIEFHLLGEDGRPIAAQAVVLCSADRTDREISGISVTWSGLSVPSLTAYGVYFRAQNGLFNILFLAPPGVTDGHTTCTASIAKGFMGVVPALVGEIFATSRPLCVLERRSSYPVDILPRVRENILETEGGHIYREVVFTAWRNSAGYTLISQAQADAFDALAQSCHCIYLPAGTPPDPGSTGVLAPEDDRLYYCVPRVSSLQTVALDQWQAQLELVECPGGLRAAWS